MDRLAKKCVIASAVVHGTLVLMLIVGPAFLGSEEPLNTSDILTLIPDIATPSGPPNVGLGNPNAGRQPDPAPLTPPEPKPPEPRPRVAPAPEPEPKPVVDPPRPNTTSLDPTDKPKPKPNRIVLTPVTPKPTTAKPNSSAADERASAEKAADQAASRLRAAVHNIQRSASPGVEVGDIGSPTGSGQSSAAFEDILKSTYFNNWREPGDATIDDAVVKVSVTIARNGSVIASRITKSSGDAAVDKSVQRLIDTVTFIRAFPPEWKESQKEFKLSFSLKAKRAIG